MTTLVGSSNNLRKRLQDEVGPVVRVYNKGPHLVMRCRACAEQGMAASFSGLTRAHPKEREAVTRELLAWWFEHQKQSMHIRLTVGMDAGVYSPRTLDEVSIIFR